MTTIVELGDLWWLDATITCAICSTRFRLDEGDAIHWVGYVGGDLPAFEVACPVCPGTVVITRQAVHVVLDAEDAS